MVFVSIVSKHSWIRTKSRWLLSLETRLESAREYAGSPKTETLDVNHSSLSPLSFETMSSRQRYAIKTLLYKKNKNSNFIYKYFGFLFSDLLDREVFVCFCCWNSGLYVLVLEPQPTKILVFVYFCWCCGKGNPSL